MLDMDILSMWIVSQNSGLQLRPEDGIVTQTWVTLQLHQHRELIQAGLFSVSFLSFSTLTFTYVQSTLFHCPALWDLSARSFLSYFVWLSGGQRIGFVYVGGVLEI